MSGKPGRKQGFIKAAPTKEYPAILDYYARREETLAERRKVYQERKENKQCAKCGHPLTYPGVYCLYHKQLYNRNNLRSKEGRLAKEAKNELERSSR